MPRYKIENRVTHEAAEIEAPFAQTACDALGWQIGDCCVRLLREGPFSGPSRADRFIRKAGDFRLTPPEEGEKGGP